MAGISRIVLTLAVASFAAAPAFAQVTSGQTAKAPVAPKATKPVTPAAPAAPTTVAPNLPANAIAPKAIAPAAPKPNIKLPAQPEAELDEVVRPNC